MKEKMLMLARACPIISEKYEHLVCIAGITEGGNWRRIYPVPWKTFWGDNAQRYKKKMWIEYEVEADCPSDHRTESRKVKPKSVKPLGTEEYKEIKRILEKKLTSLEELKQNSHNQVSLGVIKPELQDFIWEPSEHFEKLTEKQKQQTLFSKSAVQAFIPKYSFSYKFKCQGNPDCKGHTIMCEDWELGELYRHCEDYRKEGKYKDEKEVLEKIKKKMFEDMKNKKDLFFIVGTHYRFPTYIIISFIAPTKKDKF